MIKNQAPLIIMLAGSDIAYAGQSFFFIEKIFSNFFQVTFENMGNLETLILIIDT